MNHIILIGFMGAGKTSLGEKVAGALGLRFTDTDRLIEKWQQEKISDIFARRGEAYFRDLETETLRRLKKEKERMVIAVGGGLPVREENRRLMRELGTVIYLKAKTETLLARLAGDTTRPKLAGGDLRKNIERLMAEREDIYREAAQIEFVTDGKSLEVAAKEIENIVL
ncbi:MAG: shikimate kinase [Eubacteriales bacterium]|nr:shikimate kinase [Eubacteriales bacterium]